MLPPNSDVAAFRKHPCISAKMSAPSWQVLSELQHAQSASKSMCKPNSSGQMLLHMNAVVAIGSPAATSAQAMGPAAPADRTSAGSTAGVGALRAVEASPGADAGIGSQHSVAGGTRLSAESAVGGGRDAGPSSGPAGAAPQQGAGSSRGGRQQFGTSVTAMGHGAAAVRAPSESAKATGDAAAGAEALAPPGNAVRSASSALAVAAAQQAMAVPAPTTAAPPTAADPSAAPAQAAAHRGLPAAQPSRGSGRGSGGRSSGASAPGALLSLHGSGAAARAPENGSPCESASELFAALASAGEFASLADAEHLE